MMTKKIIWHTLQNLTNKLFTSVTCNLLKGEYKVPY